MYNSAYGLKCWTHEKRVTGSNPSQVRTVYCLQL